MHDDTMIIIDNNKILSTISCLSQRPVYINNLLPVKIDNIVMFLIFSLLHGYVCLTYTHYFMLRIDNAIHK